MTMTGTNPRICPCCKGAKFMRQKCRNHGTCQMEIHTVYCPDCDGRGYLNDEYLAELRQRVRGTGLHEGLLT